MYIATPAAKNMQEVYHVCVCVYYCICSAAVGPHMVTCLTARNMANFKLSRRV
jgi:hypothetical protein